MGIGKMCKHEAARKAGQCECEDDQCCADGCCETAEQFYEKELPPAIIDYFKNQKPPREVRDFILDTLNELLTEEARQAQFVSDVSHEIRTPLTAIRGTAETLLEGGVPQELQERFLTQIINECDRLTRLANDLLTLQKAEGEDIELSRINLRALADNCALLMEGLAIVRALAEAMGGSVEAANLPDAGAVFIVALPSLPPQD